MFPALSRVTPGISLRPLTRGPIPERKSKLPTRFACGNAPTGSGARELWNDSLTIRTSHETHKDYSFVSLVSVVRANCRDSRSREAFRRTQPRSLCFGLAIPRRRIRHQRMEQMLGSVTHVVHGAIERLFVRL